MRPTQHAPSAAGDMILTQPESAFGIAVDTDGHQAYTVTLRADRLPRRRGARYVGWAATPELTEWVRLGELGEAGQTSGQIAWNKFLAFVSEETEPELERWSGPIILRGISPSGRLHTMAGHGPFEDVSCQLIY